MAISGRAGWPRYAVSGDLISRWCVTGNAKAQSLSLKRRPGVQRVRSILFAKLPSDQEVRMAVDAYTVVGFIGVAIVLVAYFSNQQGWLSSEDWRFPAANLVGAVLILASLVVEWNFPSAVIEVAWILISVYGLVRQLHRRRA